MITFLQTGIHALECFHDKHVIAGSNKSEWYHNRRWHQADSLLWLFVHCVLALYAGSVWVIFTGLSIRLVLLQIGLNALRGLPLNYLGSKGIDGFCRRYIGINTTFALKIVLILFTYAFDFLFLSKAQSLCSLCFEFEGEHFSVLVFAVSGYIVDVLFCFGW